MKGLALRERHLWWALLVVALVIGGWTTVDAYRLIGQPYAGFSVMRNLLVGLGVERGGPAPSDGPLAARGAQHPGGGPRPPGGADFPFFGHPRGTSRGGKHPDEGGPRPRFRPLPPGRSPARSALPRAGRRRARAQARRSR